MCATWNTGILFWVLKNSGYWIEMREGVSRGFFWGGGGSCPLCFAPLLTLLTHIDVGFWPHMIDSTDNIVLCSTVNLFVLGVSRFHWSHSQVTHKVEWKGEKAEISREEEGSHYPGKCLCILLASAAYRNKILQRHKSCSDLILPPSRFHYSFSPPPHQQNKGGGGGEFYHPLPSASHAVLCSLMNMY